MNYNRLLDTSRNQLHHKSFPLLFSPREPSRALEPHDHRYLNDSCLRKDKLQSQQEIRSNECIPIASELQLQQIQERSQS